MDDQEKKQALIEEYFLGLLEGTALQNFEAKLKSDKSFARDVAIMKDMEAAFAEAVEDKAFAQKLQFLGNKHLRPELVEDSVTPMPRIAFFKSRWLIAATILMFLTVGSVLMWQPWSATTTTDIYAAYYEPYPTDALVRGDNNTSAINYKKALSFYDEGNYTAATPLLQERIATVLDDTVAKILLANCYLNHTPANMEAAIDLLQGVIGGEDKLYHETAQWYLALVYIRAKRIESAKPLLQSLVAKNVGHYAKLAKQVLADLE